MKTGAEILSIIANGSTNELTNGLNQESINIIVNKINEIPDSFFAARFNDSMNADSEISLIDFTMRTTDLSPEIRNGYMARFSINPDEYMKLQGIIGSIQVASEYGKEETTNKSKSGIALSNSESLDRAYPLWLAYLYGDSKNPREDIEKRLISDGKADKYDANYIVGLIEHNNSLMADKSEDVKKDLYIHTITKILDDAFEIPKEEEIEI